MKEFIINEENWSAVLHVIYCANFLSRARGLFFRSPSMVCVLKNVYYVHTMGLNPGINFWVFHDQQEPELRSLGHNMIRFFRKPSTIIEWRAGGFQLTMGAARAILANGKR